MSDVSKASILVAAYDLLGDGQGAEWDVNPEYTRAVIELVADTVGLPEEIDPGSTRREPFVLGMIYAANLLRREAVTA